MGVLKKIFTWWDGATIGTALWTRRTGVAIGQDSQGNSYYEAKKAHEGGLKRRWVIYEGANDASRVPAEWHGWLHHTHELPPTEAPVPARTWEKPFTQNLTGSAEAYRPAGALESGGRRAKATGDYEAWIPN